MVSVQQKSAFTCRSKIDRVLLKLDQHTEVTPAHTHLDSGFWALAPPTPGFHPEERWRAFKPPQLSTSYQLATSKLSK